MRCPRWWPRYTRGTGWTMPEWVRWVLVPIAVGVLMLLVVGEVVAMALWFARRLIKGK